MTYASTLVTESAWTRMSPDLRRRMITVLWWITEVGLLAGYVDRTYWEWTIAFTIVHAAVFTVLVGMRPMAFPAQLRIAYTAWLMVGTWVPGMTVLMVITTFGLTANLLFGYCPLARLLYLLPWNRDHAMTPTLALRTFLQAPRPGRFSLAT